MMDLISWLQIILRQADFRVRLLKLGSDSIVCFEDSSLIGFACEFVSVDDLLARWEFVEDEVVRAFASEFRKAREKAWNVYTVFISSASATSHEKRKVRWVEENLRRTRKIAAVDLRSREELVRALLPVLPLQHRVSVQLEDLSERLRVRISSIAPEAGRTVFDSAVSPEEVARLLGEAG